VGTGLYWVHAAAEVRCVARLERCSTMFVITILVLFHGGLHDVQLTLAFHGAPADASCV